MTNQLSGKDFQRFQNYLSSEVEKRRRANINDEIIDSIIDRSKGWKYFQTLSIDVIRSLFKSPIIRAYLTIPVFHDSFCSVGRLHYVDQLKEIMKHDLRHRIQPMKRNIFEVDGFKFDRDCKFQILYTKDEKEVYVLNNKVISKQKIYGDSYPEECKLISLYSDDNVEFLFEKGKLAKISPFFKTAFETQVGKEETNFVFEYDSNVIVILETFLYDKSTIEDLNYTSELYEFLDYLGINMPKHIREEGEDERREIKKVKDVEEERRKKELSKMFKLKL